MLDVQFEDGRRGARGDGTTWRQPAVCSAQSCDRLDVGTGGLRHSQWLCIGHKFTVRSVANLPLGEKTRLPIRFRSS